MLEMKECCKVPFPEKLFEEYEKLKGNSFVKRLVDEMKEFKIVD